MGIGEKEDEMIRCPNPFYQKIRCPYALTDDAPIPCFGSQKQCDDYRIKISEINSKRNKLENKK